MAHNNVNNNQQTFSSSRLPPNQHHWPGNHLYYNNEPIFEDHSAFMVKYRPPILESPNTRVQPQSNHARHHLLRSSSTYQYQDPNMHGPHRSEPRQQLHGHSMSLDSWQTEHLHLQCERLVKLNSEIDLCRQYLVQIEHEALTKEEEYRTLLKVAKNPTKEDCVLLESELFQYQRELQSLYYDCENLNINIPGDNPSEILLETNHVTPANDRNSMNNHRHGQYFHDPIESPSRLLLLNPYDDSLAIPMTQW